MERIAQCLASRKNGSYLGQIRRLGEYLTQLSVNHGMWIVPLVTLSLLILFGEVARAGTQFIAPPTAKQISRDKEAFPESRFGYAPADAVSGKLKIEAAEESDEWDKTNLAGKKPTGRSPAGVGNRQFSAIENGGDLAEKNAISGPDFIEKAQAGSQRTAGIFETEKLGESKASARGVQEVAIIAGDLGYFPKTVFVTKGIPVKLFATGTSKQTLCVMIDSFQVRKQLSSFKVEEVLFTPTVAGTYRFYCPVNGMEGSLVVKEDSKIQSSADRAVAGVQ